jgi:hypothetical protein
VEEAAAVEGSTLAGEVISVPAEAADPAVTSAAAVMPAAEMAADRVAISDSA